MKARELRKKFLAGLYEGLLVVWPVLSFLLALIVALGMVAGMKEGWTLQESAYFSFVSSLTIGYGDFAPKTLLGRTLAIVIGFCGILVTAVVAAVAVKALEHARSDSEG